MSLEIFGNIFKVDIIHSYCFSKQSLMSSQYKCDIAQMDMISIVFYLLLAYPKSRQIDKLCNNFSCIFSSFIAAMFNIMSNIHIFIQNLCLEIDYCDALSNEIIVNILDQCATTKFFFLFSQFFFYMS